MKNLFLLCFMGIGFNSTVCTLIPSQQERLSFCDACGIPINVDFISIYKPNGEVDRLFCKNCLKLRMKGKKDTVSSSASPSSFSLGVESDSSIVGTLPSRDSFFIDEKKVAELVEASIEKRLKDLDSEKNFLEFHGQPKTFDEALRLKIYFFTKLYEASKMPEDKKYAYTLHEAKKIADVVDPQGNEYFYSIDTIPFFWKRGGVFVFKASDSLEIKDLVNDCSYSFHPDTLSVAVLNQKCQDYGFEKVTPLTSYQEADLSYQAMLGRLPSPKF